MNKKSITTCTTLAALCMTLVMVFSFAACQHEEMPALQEESALRTVSVNLSMPQGKPVFGEGASRAATDEGAWNQGDELLMILAAGEQNSEQNSMVMMLTLKCNAQGTWDVLTDKSYTSFDNYQTFEPYSQKPMLQQATGLSLNQGTWTVKVNEEWGENIGMGVAFYYAPEMEFNANGFNLKADASTTAPEYWTAMNENVVPAGSSVSLQWNQAYSRLRVYTGMAGDEVKLTSSKFDSVFGTEPTDGVYTATTDAQGNAYFYGATVDAQGTSLALTSDLKVELTKVQGIILTTPITLLEATNLVSVTLAAGQSYKLDAAAKQQAVLEPLSIVIDGSETDLEALKSTIHTGYDAGKRIILVTGETLACDVSTRTIVGDALFSLNTYIAPGSLTLLMPQVQAVPEVAFRDCTSLTSASFPAATELGEDAFYGCTSLTNASFPKATSIGQFAFWRCTSLTNASFPKATSIGEYAFYSCTSLTNASFPAATSIGKSAFRGCTSLTNASFPAATEIGEYAFNDCTSLKSISFASITSIRGSVFSNLTTLESVSFPAATEIGEYAFDGCTSLKNVSFPAATEIGEYAFDGCTSLTNASFPAATEIGEYAFSDCTSLTNASFPKATSIGQMAFYNCTSLTNASFPKATSIGGLVFCECKKLATLNFGSVISRVGLDAFWNVGSEVEGGCALTLASGQQHMEGATPETPGTPNGIGVTETDNTWSGHTWKSITLQ